MTLQITQETAEKIHNELVKANRLATEGRRAEAKAICLSVYDLCPDYPDTNQILGLIYLQELDFHKAVRHFREALKLFPEQPGVWLRLGQALVEIRRPGEAKTALLTALKYAPNLAEAHFRLGEVSLALGKKEDAKAAFREALKLDPKMGQAARLLARTLGPEEAGALARTLKENLTGRGELTPIARANMAFGLGTCLDKAGNGPAAADLYTAARVLQAANPSWRQSYSEKFAKTKKVFTTGLLKRAVPAGSKPFKPIFIVGVPRSGSTLLEQILASHPKVFGSDEVRFSEALFQDLVAMTPHKPYPENIPDLKPEQLAGLAEKYRENMQALAPDMAVFTDKMLSNFHILGLLRMLFPDARVLNIHRDPEDTAASIARNIFSIGAAPYLASPADVGVYYRQYQDLMAFWRGLMPDFILDVAYEDLVKTPRKEIEKILAFCRLDFEESCLDFSKTERPVYSPSADQVRKPLYDTSIGAASSEGDLLAPFRLTLAGTNPMAKSEGVRQQLAEATQQIKDLSLDRAEDTCRGLLDADPHQAFAMKGLGAIALERQQFIEAIGWYRKSLAFEPRQPELWVLLGEALIGARKVEAARHAFFMARLYKPGNAEALYWLARLDMGSGDQAGADKKLAEAISIDPDYMAAYDLRLRIKGFEPDATFLGALEKAATEGGRSDLDTIYANYALAGYYVSHDKEKFLDHVKRATTLQSQIAPDEQDVLEYAAKTAKDSFNQALTKALPPAKFKKLTPVFIVGLPRSGSSLLEQMLASHGKIAAADEIPYLNARLIARLERLTGKPYPEGIQDLKPEQWGEIGGVYQEAVKNIAGEKPVVTDKMLSNGLFLGAAFMAMPWGRAIHIRRNVLDTAFSIYRHYFIEKLKFAHDLEALAAYARRMEETLGHWKALFPKNILEVDYEVLIENPEKEMKRVLKFLNLDWDPKVLEFHKTTRPMQTLSLAQVTEPISQNRTGQWRDFADLLAPFRTAVSDIIDEEGFLKR